MAVKQAGVIPGTEPGPTVIVQDAYECRGLPSCVGDDELAPYYQGSRSRGQERRHGRADGG